MTKIDWSAVFSAIAALAALLTWWATQAERRERREVTQSDLGRRWVLDVGRGKSPLRPLILRYDFADGPRVKLLAIAAARPRGLLIARTINENPDPNGPKRFAPDGALAQEVLWNADLEGGLVRSGGPVGFARGTVATVQLMAQVPPRPFWSRASGTKIRLLVKVEEISASRRHESITIASEEIAWAAGHSAGATLQS